MAYPQSQLMLYFPRVVLQRVPVPQQQHPRPTHYDRQQQPWYMWYLPQVAFPKPRVAFPQGTANAPPYMWYLPPVAFPKPRVALAQQAHMQYSPHVAFLQPRVAFPQIHYPAHMRY